MHLSSTGDWIQTDPITKEEYRKLKYAALIWAKRRGHKVSTTHYYTGSGWVCRVTLVKKYAFL